MSVTTFCCWAALLALPQQDSPWDRLWTEWEPILAGNSSASEIEAFRTRAGDAVKLGSDPVRQSLAEAMLERLAGTSGSSGSERLGALNRAQLSPRELWILSDLLPPGRDRVKALLKALEARNPLSRWQVLLAWNTAVDAARALNLEAVTLPIQIQLHALYDDAWSANELALTYKALDQPTLADELLARAITREEIAGRLAPDLWETRGIIALGCGNPTLARDHLGKAAAYGSAGATLLLARMDAAQGDMIAARRRYRGALADPIPADWAWRGWGIALLPDVPTLTTTHSFVPSRN